MLRVLHPGRNWPTQRPLDPNATFIAGTIGQLKLVGNEIVLGVSDGIAPFGPIEDTREVAHIAPVIDEVAIFTPSSVDNSGSAPVTLTEGTVFLKNANIVQNTFSSDVRGVSLIPVNGALSIASGTPLNAKINPDPSITENDSVLIRVRYSYYIPNRPGDDTTLGSNKVTVWANPSGCIFSTDQFETAVPYGLNAALFVSSTGRLTTKQALDSQPAVAMVCVPPTSINPMLEYLWL